MASAFSTCTAKNDGLGTAAAQTASQPASHPWLRGPVAAAPLSEPLAK